MIRVGSIVLRVDDLQRQTEFWEAALDYKRRESDSDDFVLLRPKDGIGPNISLDQVRSTLQIPPRLHLDLYTEDKPARSSACSRWVQPRSTGTSDRRTRTTSSSPIRKATVSAWWTSARTTVESCVRMRLLRMRSQLVEHLVHDPAICP